MVDVANDNSRCSDPAWDNILFGRKPIENHPVELLDPVCGHAKFLAVAHLGGDEAAGSRDVVELLLQVFLRLGELKTSFDVGSRLFLGQRISFDLDAGKDALDHVEPV